VTVIRVKNVSFLYSYSQLLIIHFSLTSNKKTKILHTCFKLACYYCQHASLKQVCNILVKQQNKQNSAKVEAYMQL